MSLPKNQSRIIVHLDANPIGRDITLSNEDSHHLKNVLRKKEGSEVVALDSHAGKAFLGIISGTEPAVRLKIVRELESELFSSRVEILACSLLKGDKNELICEKACELGVKKIIFWQSENSVVRLDAKNILTKTTRLQKIAASAASQSGNIAPTEIEILGNTKALLKSLAASPTPNYFCSLSMGAVEIRNISPPPEQLNIIIGPEGDFTPAEEDSLTAAGFKPLTLGPAILRAETAAITAVASVNAVLGFQ